MPKINKEIIDNRRTLDKNEFEKNEEGKNICPICGKAYGGRNVYRHITAVHDNGRRSICPECGKLVCNVQRHIDQTHRKLRLFPCDKCDTKCASAGQLKKHTQMRHEGVRETCTICGNIVANINSHTRNVHTNRYKFKCNICDKGFPDKRGVERHRISIHSGKEKRSGVRCWKCPVPINVKDLKEHEERIH